MRIRLSVIFLCTFLSFTIATRAQQITPQPMITQAVDEGSLLTLKGNTHPFARPQFDVGVAAPDQPMRRMLLVLKRSPEQEFTLRKLLDDQQDKASPNYHKWLTPNEFGQQFGPADQDLQIVTGWLQSHGLQVNRVTHGRTIIEFTGVESQVEEALHTQIHKYLVNGEEHWANASDPQIPAALAPVVAGVKALNNFPATRHSRLGGVVTRDKSTGRITSAKPLFTLGGQCGVPNGCFGVGPYDFATIYDVLPAWNASPAIDGTGETIAIVGETDINPQDVTDFRNFFGLPAYGQQGGPTLNVIHDGPAPGILSDGEESESDLDVEWSGAVAKGANIDFVVAETTETTFGIDLSALHIVDNNLAPVMSESYGQCELFIGSGGNQFFSALWQQAAAQGMTVMLSSGDGSSAGCDNFDAPGPATQGLAVSGYASTPYNVAVGGTDFNDLTNASTYWSTTNDATTHASALSYIPETTWDDTCTNPVFGTLLGFSKNAETNCNNAQLINFGFVNIVGASGGKSSCVNSDGQNPASCTAGYSKPSWQNAPGVPADGVRDVPDVSLFAASGSPSGSFYIICEADLVGGSSCDPNNPATGFLGIGGTSASSPAFAGIMALVNQQQQARQGNANFVLYKLAQHSPSSFHDVTTGTISVPCQTGTPNCTTSHSGDQFGILNGYNTGAGYDLATGIGSVDVDKLLQNWSSANFTATSTNLALSPTTNLTHGQAVTVTGSVGPTSGSGTPTGAVSLVTSTGLSVDGFKLNNGAISGSTNLLPGGSYTVTAQYFGDSNFGGSQSAPVNVTVGKENSSSQLQLITFDFSGNLLSNNATTAIYGSPYILRVNVLNSQGAACLPNPFGESACPTGNVTLTDNSSALDGGSFALNSLGYTEDQTIQLPGGSNVVKAQYAGDSSFNASSSTMTYNITPAPTTIGAPGPQLNVAVGGPEFFATMVQSSPTTGAAPTGSVDFFVNGKSIPGVSIFIPGSSGSGGNGFTASSTAQINASGTPFPAPGTYTITASYSGDGNYLGSESPATTLLVKFPPPNLSLQASSLSVATGSSVTLTALVSGASTTIAPTGTIEFFGNLGVPPANILYSTISDPISGDLDLQGSITFVPTASANFSAQYSGDSNYQEQSASNLVQITVNGADFSISAGGASLTVQPGGSVSTNLIVGFESATAPVSFATNACSGLPSEATCSFSPNPATSTSTVVATISTMAPHAMSKQRAAIDRTNGSWFTLMPIAAALLIAIPRRRGRRRVSFALGFCFLLVSLGCGGGSGSSGGGGGNTDPGTPKGSYPITVTATSGSGGTAITHTTSFTLVVQ